MKELRENTVPVECTVPAEDVARIKGLGFLRDKTTPDCFNGRVLTKNGKITAEEAVHIAEAAKRFGSGEVAMTTRQTIEIQRVPFENIEPLREFLAEKGLETGGTGPKVRPVVSCKGTTCVFGLIDTFSISEEIHHRFYKAMHNVKLPHKFKIGVGGCPNNCVKPDLNDIGIIGQRIITPNLEKCRGCKKCAIEKACPTNASKVVDGKVFKDPAICNRCGRCYEKCPFGVFSEATVAYKICIGGRWGKKAAMGKPLNHLFTSEEQVLDTVERAIILFRDEGIKGERFSDTIARLGFDYVEKKLLEVVC